MKINNKKQKKLKKQLKLHKVLYLGLIKNELIKIGNNEKNLKIYMDKNFGKNNYKVKKISKEGEIV